MKRVAALLRLCKYRITVASCLTTVTGALLVDPPIDVAALLLAVIGVFLLASASAALNHLQEYAIDARMPRTRRRPLQSGDVTVAEAWSVVVALTLAGQALLSLLPSWIPAMLGIFAMLWYNGVYTYLKRLTAFAVVPGALIGALPPVIGWTAAGGLPTDPRILALALFFFIWQVPHFWLLLLNYGREYELAGLPSMTAGFSPRQISRMTFVWITATAAACMTFPLFGVVTGNVSAALLVAAAIWMVVSAAGMVMKAPETDNPIRSFKLINVYALIVILLLSLDRM